MVLEQVRSYRLGPRGGVSLACDGKGVTLGPHRAAPRRDRARGDSPEIYSRNDLMVKLPRGGMTAEALMALLEADPEWVRRRAERDARRAAEIAKRRAELEPEQAPLRRELAEEAGLSVRSVWELVNMSAPYPKAVPVLLRHLPIARHPSLREGIARALTVQEAEGL